MQHWNVLNWVGVDNYRRGERAYNYAIPVLAWVRRFTSMYLTMIYVIHKLQFTLVTGYGGSKLTVQDSSDNHCNTNGEAIEVWANATHITNTSDCFLRQIR